MGHCVNTSGKGVTMGSSTGNAAILGGTAQNIGADDGWCDDAGEKEDEPNHDIGYQDLSCAARSLLTEVVGDSGRLLLGQLPALRHEAWWGAAVTSLL
jgi:hypothetical protein